MAQKLYELIEQLTAGGLSGRRIRRQFHDSPETVAAHLTPTGRRALYAMEKTQGGAICKVVKKELEAEGIGDQYQPWEDWFLGWDFPEEEFVPPGKLPADCQYEGQEYPDPKPFVFDIDPPSASIADGAMQEVKVSGQGFVTGRTRLELQKQGTNTTLTIMPKYSGIEGSFRCGHLYVDVTLPGSVNGPETYEIRVILTTGTDPSGDPVELGPLPVRTDPSTNKPLVFTVTP